MCQFMEDTVRDGSNAVLPSCGVKRKYPAPTTHHIDEDQCHHIGDVCAATAKNQKRARCIQCKNNQRVTGKYEDITTQCCRSCAKVHHKEWYDAYVAAYVAATRCVQCKNNQRVTEKYEGITTQCCTSCAKVHHKEWYDAWFQSIACVKNSQHLCNTIGSRILDGYCIRCFTKDFPDSPRVRWVRCKELSVLHALRDWFPDVTWVSDRMVEGGCSKKRPDVLADFGYFVLIIEVDEFQHSGSSYSCENKRMMEISRDVHHRPVVLIRFNPDAYTDEEGRKHKSPWSLTPKTKAPRVSKGKHTEEWNRRLLSLRQQIEMHVTSPPDRTVTEVKLFYDN